MSQEDYGEGRQKPQREGDALLIESRVDQLEREQGESKRRDEEYKRLQVLYNKKVAWFTGGLFATSVILNLIYLDISRTSRQSANAAEVAAKASKEASDTAAKALKDSETSFDKTLCQMQAQTAATLKLADVANKTNNIVVKLWDTAGRDTERRFREEERPYLIAEPGIIDTATMIAGKSTRANVTVRNIGHSPAVESLAYFDLVASRKPANFGDSNTFLDIQFRRLIKDATNFRNRINDQETLITRQDIAPEAFFFATTALSEPLSADDASKVPTGDLAFFLIGILDYKDPLGGSFHTEMCRYWLSINPIWYTCQTHNVIK